MTYLYMKGQRLLNYAEKQSQRVSSTVGMAKYISCFERLPLGIPVNKQLLSIPIHWDKIRGNLGDDESTNPFG